MEKATPEKKTAIPAHVRLRLFTDKSPTVTIEGKQYKVCKFTSAGISQLQENMEAEWFDLLLDSPTPGEQMVYGALNAKKYDLLVDFLGSVLESTPPEEDVFACDPDELVHAVNTFYDFSGLRWLADIMGNWTRRQRELQDQVVKSLANPGMLELIQRLGSERGGMDAFPAS